MIIKINKLVLGMTNKYLPKY